MQQNEFQTRQKGGGRRYLFATFLRKIFPRISGDYRETILITHFPQLNSYKSNKRLH